MYKWFCRCRAHEVRMVRVSWTHKLQGEYEFSKVCSLTPMHDEWSTALPQVIPPNVLLGVYLMGPELRVRYVSMPFAKSASANGNAFA